MLPDLRHFHPSEFKHPDLVDGEAARFLDDVRGRFGAPLVLTSDARLPIENAAASGSAPTSWHLVGRAFDLKWLTPAALLWRFTRAVVFAAEAWGRPVELELVDGSTIVTLLQRKQRELRATLEREPSVDELIAAIHPDQHIHLALMQGDRQSKLIVAAD